MGSGKSGMNISSRTFSDSGNQFLHSFWKIRDALDGFFACYRFPFRSLNLDLFDWFQLPLNLDKSYPILMIARRVHQRR